MTLKQRIFHLTNIICPITLTLSMVMFRVDYIKNIWLFLIIFTSVMLSILTFYFKRKIKYMLCKLLLIVNAIICLFLSLYFALKYYDLMSIFMSVTLFKNFIINTGDRGVIIYIIIQALQVIFLPIPAAVIALAGAIIYGPFLGSVYCTIGILLGSYISFYLGRGFGYKLVVWVVGKDNADKYANVLSNRGKLFLPIAFLLPLFPDDILCLISGITTMSFKYFFFTTTITRPIGVICMCYFGGGYIIPFAGWGLYIWGVLAILLIIFVIFTYKYQPRIENWVFNKLQKKKSKRIS